MSAFLDLAVLEPKLFLASITRGQLQQNLSTVLKQLLFSQRKSLFSYTETQDEVSLILDEEAASLFPKDVLHFSPGTWKAIQVLLIANAPI